MKFFGYLRVEAEGLNQIWLWSELERHKIFVTNLKREEKNKTRFTISKRNFEKAKKVGIFDRYKLDICEQKSFTYLFSRVPFRIGLFASLFFCVMFCVVFSQKMQKIEIVGANDLQKTQIVKILSDNGIAVGENWDKIDMRSVEALIFNNFSTLGNVSAKRKGVALCICCSEEVLSAVKHDAIVAQENCVVESIVVAKGKQQKQKGDLVLKGEPIVLPDENGKVVANVSVRVFAQSSVAVKNFETQLVRTGKNQTKSVLLWPFQKQKKAPQSPFEKFEVEQTTTQIFKNLFFPLSKTTYVWWELEEVLVLRDEAVERATKRAEQLALEALGESAQIVKIEIREQNGFQFVDIFAESVICL